MPFKERNRHPGPSEFIRKLNVTFQADSLLKIGMFFRIVDFSNNFKICIFVPKLHERFSRILTYLEAPSLLAMNWTCQHVISIIKIVLLVPFQNFLSSFFYDFKRMVPYGKWI